MTPEQKERERQLDKAKLQLMMKPDTIFFTSIMFSLVYVWDDTHTATAAVDGRNMFINPEFFDSLQSNERQGAFVHEVLHVALNHITRGLQHEPDLCNMAADYVVNLIVKDAGFTLPKNCLLDTRFTNMSYEQVYKILLDEQKTSKNPQAPQIGTVALGSDSSSSPGKNIPGIGKDILPPASPAEASQIEAEIADMVFKATVQAKQAGAWGSIPGQVLIELDKTLNPRLPWNVLFQNFMSNFAKDDYSWKRPNRKYLPDLIMPTAYSEAVSNLVFAIDSSGSVSDQEFGLFIQELNVVQQQLNPELITVIPFDTKIQQIHEITQDVDILTNIKFTGRGGTNIRPVLKWAKENEPEVLVIFTDGWFNQPDIHEFPDCPTLWVINDNPDFTAKTGEILHYDL